MTVRNIRSFENLKPTKVIIRNIGTLVRINYISHDYCGVWFNSFRLDSVQHFDGIIIDLRELFLPVAKFVRLGFINTNDWNCIGQFVEKVGYANENKITTILRAPLTEDLDLFYVHPDSIQGVCISKEKVGYRNQYGTVLFCKFISFVDKYVPFGSHHFYPNLQTIKMDGFMIRGLCLDQQKGLKSAQFVDCVFVKEEFETVEEFIFRHNFDYIQMHHCYIRLNNHLICMEDDISTEKIHHKLMMYNVLLEIDCNTWKTVWFDYEDYNRRFRVPYKKD